MEPASEHGSLLDDLTRRGFLQRAGLGALVLAAAGLLVGRRAAIHWAYGELLESLGVTYARERWVEDGTFVTAAGGSAGIDMMLYLVARLTSKAGARLAQLATEYDPQPPFGGIDWAHVGLLPRVMRGAISLAAPVIAAKPKWLTREDRRVPAMVQIASTS